MLKSLTDIRVEHLVDPAQMVCIHPSPLTPSINLFQPHPSNFFPPFSYPSLIHSSTHHFFYPEHPSLVGCFSCLHQDHPVVEKLSRSCGVGLQTLWTQCGIYFGAGEEVRGVVNVCLAVGIKVRNVMRVGFC